MRHFYELNRTPSQRESDIAEYNQRAGRHLAERAKWLEQFRTKPRAGYFEDDESEFVVHAPDQPRSLQVHHCFRKESIYSLRLGVEIHGWAPRCIIRYAGFMRMSDQRRTHVESQQFLKSRRFPFEPEGDVDFVLEFVEKIRNEQWVLLRYVYWGEIGMGSGLFPLTSDVVVDSVDPIQPPPNYPTLQCAAEAIVYTWTGIGDHQLIAPQYEEMRSRMRC